MKHNSAAMMIWMSLICGNTSQTVKAAEMSDSETSFSLGYYAYLIRDYVACANNFYAALNGVEPLESRARLYLSVCQYSLNMKDLAAFHFSQIDADELLLQQKKLASRLEAKLAKRLEQIRKSTWVLVPYYGIGAFSSSEPNRVSSSFFGLSAEYFKNVYYYKLSLESLKVKAKSTAVDYSQTQALAGFGLNYNSISYRARMVIVSSANTSFNGIKVFGLGTSIGLFENKTQLSIDGFYSDYPASDFRSLRVKQVTIASTQRLWSGTGGLVTGQIGANWISPSSSLNQDPNSAFSLRKIYVRYSGDLIFYQGTMQYALGYSFGSEVFGVRNDAAIVYSALEEHRSGITAGIQCQFNHSFSGRIGFSVENYIVGNNTSLLSASVNALSFLGVFVL